MINEPATVALMDTYLEQNGYVNDINKDGIAPDLYVECKKGCPKMETVAIRHPIKKRKIPVCWKSQRTKKSEFCFR